VELRGRRGDIELLPALAAYARVQRATNSETVVFIGNIAPPTPGFASVGDLARLYSGSGRLRLGFSGEDSFNENGRLIGQIFNELNRRTLILTPDLSAPRLLTCSGAKDFLYIPADSPAGPAVLQNGGQFRYIPVCLLYLRNRTVGASVANRTLLE
jgi:hypothetical protein